jgi:ketosteroid isomerase-like protein
MSEENVEVVRAIYDAVGRRDAASVFALYDPDVEVDGSRLPEAQLTGWTFMRGHDDLRAFYREWYEAWENAEDDCEELIDAGEHVISVVVRRGRGRTSGVEVEITRRAGVWTIRNGKVVRVVWFTSSEEAREAAELLE